MSKVSARWVQRMLTGYQKRTRLNISRYLLSRYEDDPSHFIKWVVTQHETWVHHFDTESKMQSKQWKHPDSPHPKKFNMVHSAGKVMASIFWDSQGVIMIDYLEQGRTINGAYYAGELRRLRQEIARKRRGKLTLGVLLLQDNAPAHTSQVAMTAATECEFEILPHPPYSPDMAPSDTCVKLVVLLYSIIAVLLTPHPSDFYLFPKLKSHLRGTQYGCNEGVIEAVNKYLGDHEKAIYFERIRKLKQRWAKFIALREIILKSNGQIFIPW